MDICVKAKVDSTFQVHAPPLPKTIKFEGWSCWITRRGNDGNKPGRFYTISDTQGSNKEIPFVARPFENDRGWV
jgi:hypothetical protein